MRSQRRLVATAALLLAGIAGAWAGEPNWYNCNCPSQSGSTPCVCPSTDPPGGLDPADTPQFVLFTHDDATMQDTYDSMMSVTKGKATSDGCPVVATMFTTVSANDCDLTKKLYKKGFEIADHTVHHLNMDGMAASEVEDEVVQAREDLSDCGVPSEDIVGFRQPFLASNPTVRQVLYDNGFLYDSTILEWPSDASLSNGMSQRVWPYTMNDGIPQNCDWFAPAQTCNKDERYPGMFEVPLWDLNAYGIYSMDYGDSNHDALEVLKRNFDAAYEGNRAPLPVFIHTPWLVDNLDAMEQFVDYALSKPNTYFVTVRQLLAWMQNPVPASQITPEILGCGNKGGAPGAAGVSVRSTVASSEAASPVPMPAAVPAPAPMATPVEVPAPAPAVDELLQFGAPTLQVVRAAGPAPEPAMAPAMAPMMPAAESPMPAADGPSSQVEATAELAPSMAPMATAVSSGAAGRAAATVAAAVGAALTLALLI